MSTLPRLSSGVSADGTCTTMIGDEVVAISQVAPPEVSLPAWPWRERLTDAESSSTVDASMGGRGHGRQQRL